MGHHWTADVQDGGCSHADEDVVDRPGANPVCINCGEINPEVDHD